MKKFLIKGLLLATLAVTNFACEDDYKYGELVRDNRPTVPVSFPGATTYGGNPFIEVQASGPGTIRFTLAIPESSGRTIREITTVAGGGTGVNAGTLATASAKYNTAPIPGNGTTAVFETTLAAFRTKYPTVAATPSGNPASPREIAFIFQITLDNGDQIITQQVRVRIL